MKLLSCHYCLEETDRLPSPEAAWPMWRQRIVLPRPTGTFAHVSTVAKAFLEQSTNLLMMLGTNGPCPGQFACHSISSSCPVNAKSKEMHRDTVHNPSQCLLLCTEVDQCLWLQRFIIQNAEDVSVINCVFACDVRVLPNLKEFSMLTKLLEFFISLYGKCCGWNRKCSLLVSSSKSKWKEY